MNITPDPSGIGNWSKQQFIHRFKMYMDSAYKLPDVNITKGELHSVMPWTMYAGMTTADLGAIFEYLRTIPPVSNKLERSTAGVK